MDLRPPPVTANQHRAVTARSTAVPRCLGDSVTSLGDRSRQSPRSTPMIELTSRSNSLKLASANTPVMLPGWTGPGRAGPDRVALRAQSVLYDGGQSELLGELLPTSRDDGCWPRQSFHSEGLG